MAVKELITKHNLDIVLITVTWLREVDDISKKSTCLTLESGKYIVLTEKQVIKVVDWNYYIMKILMFTLILPGK